MCYDADTGRNADSSGREAFMSDPRPTIFVTGIAGRLALRLYPLLQEKFDVAGADLTMPRAISLARFETMDLGREACCDALVDLFRELQPAAVLHLASVGSYTADADERFWQQSVAGTARVMESIAVYNRLYGHIGRFLHLSSARVYGDTGGYSATEDGEFPRLPLLSLRHQQESDAVVRRRAPEMGGCACYLLRPQWLAGLGERNLLLDALRGIPQGSGAKAKRLRQRGKRLPLVMPLDCDREALQQQYLHPDDLLRLIIWLVEKGPRGGCSTLNVAGRGPAISQEEATNIAGLPIKRAPGWWARRTMRRRWEKGLSSLPPESFGLLTSASLVDCTRLEKLLGSDYTQVIRRSSREALTAGLQTEEVPEPVAP